MQMPDGAQRHIKLWSAKDLRGFAVRVELQDGPVPVISTFEKIDLNPPRDPSLLAVPSDFTAG